MNKEDFNIIAAFQDYAIEQGWNFLFSLNEFENNLSNLFNDAEGINTLICDVKETPSIENEVVTSVNYECLLMLGRKFDPTLLTNSNLSETHKQKYDRRLSELRVDLIGLMKKFGCTHDLRVFDNEIYYEINVYDSNADFAVCDSARFSTL